MVSAAPPLSPGTRLAPYGVALLPLALAGALPWWTVAALSALLALGVRWPVWTQGRTLITQLLLGLWLLTALPGVLGQPEALAALGAQYVLFSVLGFALIWGATILEEGRRRGLLAPLLIGLLFPQPLVLAALVGGALARPGHHAADPLWPERRAWWGLLGAGLLGVTLLAALLAALLPPAPPLWTAVRLETGRVAGGKQAVAQPPTRKTERPAPEPGASGSVAPTPQMNLGELGLPGELTLLGGLLCLAAAWRVFQGRTRRRGPPHPVELAMVLGLLMLGLAWGVAAGLLFLNSDGSGVPGFPIQETRNELGQGGAEGEAVAPRLLPLALLLKALPWLTALLFLGLGLWLLCLRLRADPALAESPHEPGAAHAQGAAPEALHRVRQAYREASAGLAAAGLARTPAETPAAYAARLGAAHPALAAPLQALTAAYEPVRYGGQLTEQDAQAAEAAARTLQTLAPTLTPPEDTP
ncbi:DUF4129 domain-containing protein [Deinococcus arcticus]|uniref:Protein-glutamine gamma-glutamyltransferase-like C-terminal domain-containing protein n=1 Tax=Deinococcus arcticus TaxID=2136176 RepID=A0A2T3WCH5_9DEIO|nr:DUF4129 domain-containing protein [Deinococcus arcticus]PTA69504.1 hypothetical protein C8263_00240 [Deinococcus arcticus]